LETLYIGPLCKKLTCW